MAEEAYPNMPEYALEDKCEQHSVTYYPNHGSQIYEDVDTAAGV